MRVIPVSVLLSWPEPNYVDPITRGNASLVVNLVFLSLALFAVALRYYSRLSVKKWYGIDDVMITIASMFAIGLTVTVVLATKRYYWDRHIWDMPLEGFPPALICALLGKLNIIIAATFTRLSLCCFYYRLVGNSGVNWFRYVVFGAFAFNITAGATFTLLAVFMCTPVNYYWEYPPTGDGFCLDEGKVTLGIGIANLFTDLLVAMVPVPLIMRSRMPLRQRLGVSILFSLGVIVIIAGAIRTYYIWKSLMATYDETWWSYPLWIAAAVEIDVGIICACAPALKTLLHFSKLPEKFSGRFSRVSHKLTGFSTKWSGSKLTGSKMSSTNRSKHGSIWRSSRNLNNVLPSLQFTSFNENQVFPQVRRKKGLIILHGHEMDSWQNYISTLEAIQRPQATKQRCRESCGLETSRPDDYFPDNLTEYEADGIGMAYSGLEPWWERPSGVDELIVRPAGDLRRPSLISNMQSA